MQELKVLTPWDIHIISLCMEKGYEIFDIVPDFQETFYTVCVINRKLKKIKFYDVYFDEDGTMTICHSY